MSFSDHITRREDQSSIIDSLIRQLGSKLKKKASITSVESPEKIYTGFSKTVDEKVILERAFNTPEGVMVSIRTLDGDRLVVPKSDIVKKNSSASIKEFFEKEAEKVILRIPEKFIKQKKLRAGKRIKEFLVKKEAGIIPGVPDGTGPMGETEFCPMTDDGVEVIILEVPKGTIEQNLSLDDLIAEIIKFRKKSKANETTEKLYDALKDKFPENRSTIDNREREHAEDVTEADKQETLDTLEKIMSTTDISKLRRGRQLGILEVTSKGYKVKGTNIIYKFKK